MPKKTRDHQSWLIEKLTDPERAADYLNAAREDSREMFLEALRDIAQARQVAKVAREANITRESVYRATSQDGNPTLDTLDKMLAVFGIEYKFQAIEPSSTAPISEAPHSTTLSGRLDSAAIIPSPSSPTKFPAQGFVIGTGYQTWNLNGSTPLAIGRTNIGLMDSEPSNTGNLVPIDLLCQRFAEQQIARNLNPNRE